MPTEELFGAYHFLLEVAGGEPTDSFDFTAKGGGKETALLLPAIQMARNPDGSTDAEEQKGDFQIEEAPPEAVIIGLLLPAVQKAGGEQEDWIDILTINQGVSRSDGGDDFML